MAAKLTFGLHWVRQRQRALTRGVLALFVLAWLQAAALPCVMAHSGADAPPPAAHDCVYCPPADAAHGHCADSGSCAYPHEPQVDARAVVAMFVALAPSSPATSVVAGVRGSSPPDRRLDEPIPRIPIPVSYCRFIE